MSYNQSTVDTVDAPPAVEAAISNDAPRGMIPRLEPTPSHKRVYDIVTPQYVMVGFHRARQLVKRGETAASYFHPDTDVITTTTVNDTELNRITLDHELSVISQFKPAYHIPADYPVYQDTDADTRRHHLEQYLTGTQAFTEQIQTTMDTAPPPTTIPLIKGLSTAERTPGYELATALDAPLVAYYCTQYFTNGYRKSELLADLDTIATELPDEMPLLVIGVLSDRILSNVPSQVVAAAGLNQWFDPLSPQTDTPAEISESYTATAETVHQSLSIPSPGPLTI